MKIKHLSEPQRFKKKQKKLRSFWYSQTPLTTLALSVKVVKMNTELLCNDKPDAVVCHFGARNEHDNFSDVWQSTCESFSWN